MPPTSEDSSNHTQVSFNGTEITGSPSSGYSTLNSSQCSEENLKSPKLHSCEQEKVLLEYLPNQSRREFFDPAGEFDEKSTDNSSNESHEESSFWIPIVTKNQFDPHKEWYNKLLAFREQFRSEERGSFPPYPPQPPASAFLNASQATHVNPFDEVKHSNVKDFDHYLKQRNSNMFTHRFQPSDFLSIPPPHVFMDMIRTLAPHQYVDLTYALAGSILLDLGVRIPEEFPPLPPKMEPICKWVECHTEESEVSSQSSSDGEYSDDSATTKMEKKKAKAENMKRRSARRDKILNKNEVFDEVEQTQSSNQMSAAENEKKAIEHEKNYKMRTLSSCMPNFPNSAFRPLFLNPSTAPYQSVNPINVPIMWNPIVPYVFAAIPPQYFHNAINQPIFPISQPPFLPLSSLPTPVDENEEQTTIEEIEKVDPECKLNEDELGTNILSNSMQRIIENECKTENKE